MSEKWSAIVPQGISTSKIYVCKGICLKNVKEAKCCAGNETEVGADGRC
jgi:hypothetical protein